MQSPFVFKKSYYLACYTYDSGGRILLKSEEIMGQALSTGYAYDDAGRLLAFQRGPGPVVTLAYDANGNRTTYAGLAATYDAQDRLLHGISGTARASMVA